MKKTILGIAMAFISVYASATETWTIKTPMPKALNSFGIACIDSMIYCIGGTDANSTVYNSCYAYNINTNSWSTKAPMPSMRLYFQVAVVNGKIYAIGGSLGPSPLNTVEEYDPLTNTWTTKSPMPTSRQEFSAGVLNGKIYVAGGWSSGTGGSTTTRNELEEYNPSSDVWTTKTPMKHGKIQENGGVAVGGKYYYMGGRNNVYSEYYDSCLVYNIATDTWTNTANMPEARYAGAATTSHGEVYYLCGAASGTLSPAFNTNYRYSPATGTWSLALPALNRRSFCAAVTAGNGHIFLIGGVDSSNRTVNWNHEYTPEIPAGVEEVKVNAITAYPNPTHDEAYLNLPVATETVRNATITDELGRVSALSYNLLGTRLTANLSSLPSGQYVIKVFTDGHQYISKIEVN